MKEKWFFLNRGSAVWFYVSYKIAARVYRKRDTNAGYNPAFSVTFCGGR